MRRCGAMLGRLMVCACVWLLLACSSAPVQQDVLRPPRDSISHFSMEGRVAIRTAERADTVRLIWQHSEAEDVIGFASPLGNMLAELQRDARGARWLTKDGESFEARSADQLMARVTKEPVPIAALSLWVLGRVGPAATDVLRDEQGRLLSASDEGWAVSVATYESAKPEALPAVIEAVRGNLRIRLAIELWQL